MCGIAGLVDPDRVEAWRENLAAFDRALAHRGPDDAGVFCDRRERIAFMHRRLSILDLSTAAHQPMVRGDVVLAYNGEVYNFRELRRELELGGAVFSTTSDTEVVIEAYRAWGIACVEKFRGMFAFALADLARHKVFLVRDQLGVKPLYVGQVGGTWMFASELKAFDVWSKFRPELDADALRQYLRFLWIPGRGCGLRGVAKLEPGTWMELDLTQRVSRTHRYWSPVAIAGLDVEQLRQELARSVTEQLVSDVPLGAFLSGGLDSSLVVALMNATNPDVSTYSVGYRADDLAYDIVADDLPFARLASRALGTHNTELVLEPDVAALLPKVVEALDEPLGDPAALSAYLICAAAKQKVLLSGVGADELFGGYPRQRALLYGAMYRRAPRSLRALVSRGVERMPGSGRGRWARVGRASKKFLASIETTGSRYLAMESYFSTPMLEQLLDPSGPLATVASPTEDPPIETLEQAIRWDLENYLPNLNLAYTDRTSMAHGIEVRVPYLDLRLVELALGLRAHDLIRWRRGALEGKWLLKRAAEPFLPAQIIWRKKAGFGAPIRSWLRNDLVEMRRDVLGKLAKRGWFDPRGIAALEADFDSGRADNALHVWMLISLELWAQRFLDQRR